MLIVIITIKINFVQFYKNTKERSINYFYSKIIYNLSGKRNVKPIVQRCWAPGGINLQSVFCSCIKEKWETVCDILSKTIPKYENIILLYPFYIVDDICVLKY